MNTTSTVNVLEGSNHKLVGIVSEYSMNISAGVISLEKQAHVKLDQACQSTQQLEIGAVKELQSKPWHNSHCKTNSSVGKGEICCCLLTHKQLFTMSFM